MPQTLNFTGATLLKFERTPKSGSAHFSAELTASVAKAMGWTDLPESAISAKLDGELAASVATLTPKDKEISKHEIEIDITSVDTFSVVRLETERSRGMGHRREVRFLVSFVAPDTAALLETYMLKIGEAKSTLKVSYVKQMALEEQVEEIANQKRAAAE